MGMVSGYEQNTHLYVNGRKTYQLLIHADYHGESRVCTSRSLVRNELPENQIGRQIFIYLDPQKPKRYYVAADSIF